MPRGAKILLWILGAFVFLLAGVVLVGPLLLPGDLIRSRIVDTLQARTGRSVSVENLSIRFIPSTRLRLAGVSIGSAPTGPRQEIEIEALDLRVALGPLLRKQVQVSRVDIVHPRIRIEVSGTAGSESHLADGAGAGVSDAATQDDPGNSPAVQSSAESLRSGYVDGTKVPSPGSEPGIDSEQTGPALPLQIHVERFLIRDGELLFHDQAGKPIVQLRGYNERLTATARPNGDWELVGDSDVASVTAHLPAGTFGEGLSAQLRKDLRYSAADDRLTIRELQLRLGDLPVKVEGHVDGLQAGNLRLTLELRGGPGNVGDILAYFPTGLLATSPGIRSSGTVQLTAHVHGAVGADVPLDYDLALGLTGGRIEHPDMPQAISGLAVDLTATPERLELKRFEAHLGNGRVEASGAFFGPNADPDDQRFDVALMTDLSLEDALPWLVVSGSSSQKADGKIMINFTASGCPAAVNHLDASGEIRWDLVQWASDALPVAISEASGHLRLAGSVIRVEQCKARLGTSDLALNGTLRNWSALLDEPDSPGLLEGQLQLQSGVLNCDELFPAIEHRKTEESAEKPTVDEPPLFLAALGKVSARIGITIDEFVYDRLQAKQAHGVVRIDRGQVTMETMDAQAFGGAVHLEGKLDGRQITSIPFDIQARAAKVQAAELYEYLAGLNRYGGLGGYLTGEIDAEAHLKGDLKEDLNLDLSGLSSEGSIETHGASISEHPLQNSLASYFDAPEIRSLHISDWLQPFEIKDGTLRFEGLSLKAEGLEVSGSGWQGLDGRLGMNLDLLLPARISGQALNDVPQELRPLLANKSTGRILLPVKVSGTFDAPRVDLDKRALSTRAQDLLRQRLAQEQDRISDELGKRAGQLLKNLTGEKGDSSEVETPTGKELKREVQGLLKDLFKKR